MSDLASSEEELLSEGKKRPGPKPGGYNPGAFKQNDPRILKGGRNNPVYQLRQAATAELIQKAVDAYSKVLSDPTHKDYASVARDVLNRNEGSPITQLQKRAQEAVEAGINPKELSDEDLLSLLQGEAAIDGELIDAEEG